MAALPWVPTAFDKASVHALRAMSHGTASADQQKRALEFIVKELCETDGLSFRPDELGGARGTAFAEGKRHVGLQLRKFILMPLDERGEPKVTNE
jgi:hypothetical protein